MPGGNPDERELLLSWLGYLRISVMSKLDGLDEQAAHWTSGEGVLSMVGIINHLTRVEWRWVDGGMLGEPVVREESEFHPGAELTVPATLRAYRLRAETTDAYVRSAPSLAEPCGRKKGTDLRWVLLHLINETARHAGHADATRQRIDGLTGE